MTGLKSFECSLMPMSEYLSMPSEKKRYGRYHGTNFWDVKGYGQKKWVVSVRIKLENPEEAQGLSDKEVLEGCINFLNTPPPRKKYARKDPTPKYGRLSLYRGKNISHKVGPEGSRVYSVLVLVEKQKNKFFWSKGKNV